MSMICCKEVPLIYGYSLLNTVFDILLNISLSVSFSAARDRFNKDDILLNGGKPALNLWQIQIFSDISYVTLKMLDPNFL